MDQSYLPMPCRELVAQEVPLGVAYIPTRITLENPFVESFNGRLSG